MLVNEGTWGKALAEYVQAKLQERGYESPFVCCEDWGWWVELRNAPFKFGVCIYSSPANNELPDYACTDGAPGAKKWSWKKFRFVDTAPWVLKLHDDLMSIFQAEGDVTVVSISEVFPDWDEA